MPTAATVAPQAAGVALAAGLVWSAYVCWQKDLRTRALLVVVPFVWPATVWGACSLASPGSRWAQKHYDADKLARADDRHRSTEIADAWQAHPGDAATPDLDPEDYADLDAITRRALRKAGVAPRRP